MLTFLRGRSTNIFCDLLSLYKTSCEDRTCNNICVECSHRVYILCICPVDVQIFPMPYGPTWQRWASPRACSEILILHTCCSARSCRSTASPPAHTSAACQKYEFESFEDACTQCIVNTKYGSTVENKTAITCNENYGFGLV